MDVWSKCNGYFSYGISFSQRGGYHTNPTWNCGQKRVGSCINCLTELVRVVLGAAMWAPCCELHLVESKEQAMGFEKTYNRCNPIFRSITNSLFKMPCLELPFGDQIMCCAYLE